MLPTVLEEPSLRRVDAPPPHSVAATLSGSPGKGPVNGVWQAPSARMVPCIAVFDITITRVVCAGQHPPPTPALHQFGRSNVGGQVVVFQTDSCQGA